MTKSKQTIKQRKKLSSLRPKKASAPAIPETSTPAVPTAIPYMVFAGVVDQGGKPNPAGGYVSLYFEGVTRIVTLALARTLRSDLNVVLGIADRSAQKAIEQDVRAMVERAHANTPPSTWARFKQAFWLR